MRDLRRFTGFAVVVVTFFDEILDDFWDFFGMCLFPEEDQPPIWEVTVFPRKSEKSLDVKHKHTFYPLIMQLLCAGEVHHHGG